MIDYSPIINNVARKPQFFRWLSLLMLAVVLPFLLFKISTAQQAYPDLSDTPIFGTAIGFCVVLSLADFMRQTVFIELIDQHVTVKKWLQKPFSFTLDVIQAHNERRDRGANTLTIYLAHNYFVLRANEFADYDQLREQLCQYGRPSPNIDVMTRTERSVLRWSVIGLVVLTIGNLAFTFVAHNPDGKQPAELVSMTDVVSKVMDDRPKGNFKGVSIALQHHPDFSFYVARKLYAVRLEPLKSAIALNQPITLRIRESDFRKKIQKTQPLSFGDKYVDYKDILVYELSQSTGLQLSATQAAREPSRTNLFIRTFILGAFLLFCWTGWVAIDRYKVIN